MHRESARRLALGVAAHPVPHNHHRVLAGGVGRGPADEAELVLLDLSRAEDLPAGAASQRSGGSGFLFDEGIQDLERAEHLAVVEIFGVDHGRAALSGGDDDEGVPE